MVLINCMFVQIVLQTCIINIDQITFKKTFFIKQKLFISINSKQHFLNI
jgi:hypothetical protein